MKLDHATSRYAGLLGVLSNVGMILLFTTFLLYFLGIIDSRITPEEITRLWHLDVATFHNETETAVGWDWISEIATGSGISFAALVFLAFCTLICLIALIPIYHAEKDTWYLAIVLGQIIVLVVAASGVAVIH